MPARVAVTAMGFESIAGQRARFLATAADSDLPIVDAHHHFFDLEANDHPWLKGERLSAFRYGDYSAICRDFMPDDYQQASGAHRIVKTVLMEGEWNPADPVGEARWVAGLAAKAGRPNAMAAQIWLDRDDVGAVLDAYAGLPLVRSVRHKPKARTRAAHAANFAAPGSMRCRRWRDGYARLQAAGLHFELQAPLWHFGEAVELARDFPGTLIIVNHAGLPADRSDQGLKAWRMALDRLADAPNVVMKVSGIGVPGEAWTAALQAPVIAGTLAAFGTGRVAFASNYPVDSLCASFATIFDVFKAVTADLAPATRLALFHDNATDWYRL